MPVLAPVVPFRKPILAASLVLAFSLYVGAAQAAPQRNQQVHDKAEQAQGDAWKLVERLVNIDSGTYNEKGLDQVGAIVTAELTQLGARIETFAATPARSRNIVATFSGSGKAKILLVAHMDTVFVDGSAAARPFTIRDKRAYGPGVMDDKGGIAVGLYALKMLQQIGFRNYARITFLFNTNEETGSAGSRELIDKLGKQHEVVLNLEPGRVADGLVIWRKGSANAEIEVKGKSAHAGVAPESGRNAVTEMSHQILQMGQLGDKDKLTSVNFTVTQGGTRSNVIPDHAVAQGDVRAATNAEFDRVEKDMLRLAQNHLVADTEVTTKLVRSFPPMPQNPQSDALAAKAQAIYAELGRKLTLEGSGGASDASFTAGVGTPTLDGFGIVGGGIHTAEEYAEVDSMAPRLYLLARMLMELGAAK